MRIDAVAERLRHLAAFAVDGEAVRQQRVVRRAAVEHRRGQQRRMEPAAMLVRAFEIQIGRELQRSPCASRAARASASCRNRTRRRACRGSSRTCWRRRRSARADRASATPRCRSLRRASPLLPAIPACADAARRFPCARRTPSARPTGAGARASSPGGSRSCCTGAACPTTDRTPSPRCLRARFRAGSCAPSFGFTSMPANHCDVAR